MQMKIYPVVHVIHTMSFLQQREDIAQPITVKRTPIPAILGTERVVQMILTLGKRARTLQLFTINKGFPTHDAALQPLKYFLF